MRNTRGPALYQGDWGRGDYTRWTTENKANIPYGWDLTNKNVYGLGYFAMPMDEVK
tara:strand:+ start:1118 stop:1285 length:168 start_codon:yes stop_codon:yes gene_type:complete